MYQKEKHHLKKKVTLVSTGLCSLLSLPTGAKTASSFGASDAFFSSGIIGLMAGVIVEAKALPEELPSVKIPLLTASPPPIYI